MPNPEILTVVIQKPNSNGDRGRLYGPTIDLFEAAGYPFEFPGRSMETYVIDKENIRIVARGNREIVSFVAEENGDVAIVGYDRSLDVEPRLRGRVKWEVDLGFAGCTFRLGVDDGTDKESQKNEERMRFINSLKDEQGAVRPPTLEDVRVYLLDPAHPEHRMEEFIATEHPNALILKARERGVNLYYRNVAEYSSGVEGARNKDGLKYLFIADLISTGGTMRDNGYVPQAEELFVSQAGVVRSAAQWPEEKEAIYAELKEAFLRVRDSSDDPKLKENGHLRWLPFRRTPIAATTMRLLTTLMLFAPVAGISAKKK